MRYNEIEVKIMTKYEQIAKRLEQKILNHEYRQGERLPSIIKLAEENHCSKSNYNKKL